VIVAGPARRVGQASSAVPPERRQPLSTPVNEYFYLAPSGAEETGQEARQGPGGDQMATPTPQGPPGGRQRALMRHRL
jgi:hypothetical protein